MTALAFAGIAIFAIALVVVAIGMSRQAVRYVRDVRDAIRAGTATNVRDRPLEDTLSLGKGAEADVDPRPPTSEGDVPPGWGFPPRLPR